MYVVYLTGVLSIGAPSRKEARMIHRTRAPQFLGHYERLRRGWRISQLAALANTNNVYISLMERGRLTPTPDELERIGRALGIPPDSVMKRIDVPQAEEQEVGA
jgi:hypothetical protein